MTYRFTAGIKFQGFSIDDLQSLYFVDVCTSEEFFTGDELNTRSHLVICIILLFVVMSKLKAA